MSDRLASYKEIAAMIERGDRHEAKEHILKLREAWFELRDENQSLKQEIQNLQAKKDVASSLKFDGSLYWLYEDDLAGDAVKSAGPFCQRCWDVDSNLVRLQGRSHGRDIWTCLGCEKVTYGQGYVPRDPNVRRTTR